MWEVWIHTARVCEPNASALPPVSVLGNAWGLSDHLSPSGQPWFTDEKIRGSERFTFWPKSHSRIQSSPWQGGYLELLKLGSHIFPSHPRTFQTKDRAALPPSSDTRFCSLDLMSCQLFGSTRPGGEGLHFISALVVKQKHKYLYTHIRSPYHLSPRVRHLECERGTTGSHLRTTGTDQDQPEQEV